MPGALPEWGNPIHNSALFLAQDVVSGPRGVAQPTAPLLHWLGSQPCCTQLQHWGHINPPAVLFCSKASFPPFFLIHGVFLMSFF